MIAFTVIVVGLQRNAKTTLDLPLFSWANFFLQTL